MASRFALVNFLVCLVLGGAWAEGLFTWVADMPPTSIRMAAFMGLLWLAGVAFVLRRKWRVVFHIANELPMVGLVFTGVGIQLSGEGMKVLGAAGGLATFHTLIASLSTTFIGLALMIHLRALAFWCGDEHV